MSKIRSGGGGGGGTSNHAALTNLGFPESGHTGFQEKLIAGDNIQIDADGKTISASGQPGPPGAAPIIIETVIGINWSGDGTIVPHSQRFDIPEIEEESLVIVRPSAEASRAEVMSYTTLNVHDGGQGKGYFLLRAFGTLNSIPIPVNVAVFKLDV